MGQHLHDLYDPVIQMKVKQQQLFQQHLTVCHHTAAPVSDACPRYGWIASRHDGAGLPEILLVIRVVEKRVTFPFLI